jgi:predicted Holliday junction resolvase-like endonuclease
MYELALGLMALFLLVVIVLYWRENGKLRLAVQELRFSKQSISTKHGKMAEQFMPFLKEYPYDSGNFRFLGTPVDGVQFNDDSIVFMEFKTGDSKLSDRQKKIKELVERKKVGFEEIRLS